MSTTHRTPIYAIWINYFFLFAAFAAVVPYLQLFFASQGFRPSEVGLLLGFFQVAGMVGPLVVGHLADRTGRFRTIRGAAVVLASLAFLTLNMVEGFAAAGLLAVVAGFSFRSGVPLTDAHASNLMVRPELEYGRARFVGSIGFIACSAAIQLTGHMADADANTIVSTIVVLLLVYLSVIVLMPSLRKRPASPESGVEGAPKSAEAGQHGEQEGFGLDTAFWLFIGIIVLAQTGMAAYNSFFSLYLEQEVGTGLVSAMWAIGAVAEVPFILFAGFFIRRFGIRAMLTVGFLSITVRLIVYALVPEAPVVAATQLLHAFSFGLVYSAGMGYVNRRVPSRQRGLGIAIFSSAAMALSTFVGSAIGGFVIERAGFSGLFLSYALLPLLAIGLLFMLSRRLSL
jgi:PPP family 3-phenylpropionic acid transporter